jgi:WAS protein family homolog 1
METASNKIESLKGSKKAIRIYSPAKYPISNPPKFSPTFQKDFEATSDIDFSYTLQANPFDKPEEKKYSDKLQFFHLKRSRQSTLEKPNLVFNTKSINSLITFVNNENIILNDAIPKTRIKEQTVTVDESDTNDFSRFSTLMKNKQDADNFHYFPNMNQAPEIELPIDLPDLPGIANDISFSISDQELIAPSLAKMNIINELPNVAELIEAETNKKIQEEKISLVAPTMEVKSSSSVVSAPSVPVNIPPPPPPIPQNFIPPPPPIPMSAVADKKPAEPTQPQPKVPQSEDSRSSLMQAIRNAAGKSKLRSIPAADEQAPTAAKKKPQAAPAGDLMSDLHAKLALRRRGIAGSKEAKKEKASLMEKVSSLIPEPSKRSESEDDSGSSDNDWD